MSAPILRLSTLQKLVFLVNSRLGLFTAAIFMAPLLANLRGHFAEFLNKGSSARLGILYLPTCVGFGTGALVWIVTFLGNMESSTSLLMFSIPIGFQNL